ncbi:hypothetical protein C7974DRAFT_416128 [Boeremia exigua]|uniref:uncharacterized protein n=1 Tax=Boeremia exigua TaxID=749465 RepID=UPI001E8E2EA0|nr:uncharacterized protein C7974DRAFT_416128 [Boeremia exigua]KAH6618778.1 hypothetical protein C7974DRAFT_416128 [Boeremia exigua]
MATPQAQAVRRWIMTGAVASITVAGTIYGAGLKSDQELKKERKRYQQASPEEIISHLQIARDNLVLKKNEVERKIASFHEKKKAKAMEAEALKQRQAQAQAQEQQPR